MLNTKTPDDIHNLSLNDVVKLIPVDLESNLPKPVNRMKVIRIIFQILGYDLSSDLALALCAEPQAQLVIATAGGGKTTGAQIKAICEKIWRTSSRTGKKITGDKILCLVYNKHNVKPMEQKHRALVNRLRMANIQDLNIDDQINASTMHSFCDQIRKENVAKLQYIDFHLQKEKDALTLIRMVKNKMLNKHNIKANPSDEDILALYNYAKESMLDVSQLHETDKFQDIKLSAEVLQQIFEYYERLKRAKKRYDYVDMLTSVYKLLSEDAEALRSTQKYFDYIIADEIQDFTPIMMSLLQLFVSNGTPLMCIGDEDQGIYNFRGADIYNTLDFANKFKGGEVYSLTRNRRCRAKILDYAKEVISENTIRYHKQIDGIKDGGDIDLIPFNTIEGEHLKLISMLEALPDEILDDSVICYRDRISSVMLVEMLAERGIPFHVISGFEAYSHILYKDMLSVLNALEAPYDKSLSISLYKVLPVKKDTLYNIFGYDAGIRRFKTDTKQHFAQYDYNSVMGIRGFAEAMETLKYMSQIIQTETMDKIYPIVFKLLERYHWKFIRSERESATVYDDFIETRVDRMFNQHKTFAQVYDELSNKMEKCRRNNLNKIGVAISTFHGLKGLEYTNCYLIDLDNNRFPNYSLIDNRPYSDKIKTALKECETRLFYVAITRAKDYLCLFYNEENPSRYLLPKLKGKLSKVLSISDALLDDEQSEIESAQSTETQELNSINGPEFKTMSLFDDDDDLLSLLDDHVDSYVETISVSSDTEDDLLDLLDDNEISTENTSVEDLQNIDIETVQTKSQSDNVSTGSYLNNLLKSLRS